jgi:hypothetical protein
MQVGATRQPVSRDNRNEPNQLIAALRQAFTSEIHAVSKEIVLSAVAEELRSRVVMPRFGEISFKILDSPSDHCLIKLHHRDHVKRGQ